MSPPIHRPPSRSNFPLLEPIEESPVLSKIKVVAQECLSLRASPVERFTEIDLLNNLITDLTISDATVADYMKSCGITSCEHKLLQDDEFKQALLSCRLSIHDQFYPELTCPPAFRIQRWAQMQHDLSSDTTLDAYKIQALTTLIEDREFTDLDINLLLENMQIFKTIKTLLSISADSLTIKNAFSKFRPLLSYRLYEPENPIEPIKNVSNYAKYFQNQTVDMQIKTLIAVIQDTHLSDEDISRFIEDYVNKEPNLQIQVGQPPITCWFKIAKINYHINLENRLMHFRPLLASQLITQTSTNK